MYEVWYHPWILCFIGFHTFRRWNLLVINFNTSVDWALWPLTVSTVFSFIKMVLMILNDRQVTFKSFFEVCTSFFSVGDAIEQDSVDSCKRNSFRYSRWIEILENIVAGCENSICNQEIPRHTKLILSCVISALLSWILTLVWACQWVDALFFLIQIQSTTRGCVRCCPRVRSDRSIFIATWHRKIDLKVEDLVWCNYRLW